MKRHKRKSRQRRNPLSMPWNHKACVLMLIATYFMGSMAVSRDMRANENRKPEKDLAVHLWKQCDDYVCLGGEMIAAGYVWDKQRKDWRRL